jgi:hypothetical protein
VFFAPVPFYLRANLRHYRFLAECIPDISQDLAARNIGLVLRPHDRSLLKFCEEVRPAIVVGDENPLRETEECRVARKIRVPLWTVDADMINPVAPPPCLQSFPPQEDFLSGWTLDRSVSPVSAWSGGTRQALRVLREFVRLRLADYPEARNHSEQDGTSRLSPYLHFGHLGPHTVALAVQQSDAPAGAKAAFLEQIIRGASFQSILSASILGTSPSSAWSHGPGAPFPSTPAAGALSSTVRNNWSRARPTILCGTQLISRWFRPAGCTAICARTGPRKFWSGVPPWRWPTSVRYNSTTVMNWTGGIPTRRRVSPGYRGKTRPRLVGPPSVRQDPLHVMVQYKKEVQFRALH